MTRLAGEIPASSNYTSVIVFMRERSFFASVVFVVCATVVYDFLYADIGEELGNLSIGLSVGGLRNYWRFLALLVLDTPKASELPCALLIFFRVSFLDSGVKSSIKFAILSSGDPKIFSLLCKSEA